MALAACDSGEVVLVVDVKTDYVPGRQFFGVRTELGDADLAAVTAREDTFATLGDAYLEGQRVAELRGLTRGTVAVRVSLLDAMGEIIAARTTVVTLSSQQALTVLITSSCQDVTCPGAMDDPALSACVGGRCVDPRCSPQTPEFCGAPGCRADADCDSPIACATGACVDSECFLALDDAQCGPSEFCDPQLGCVLRPEVDGGPPEVDAGPSCPATETECSDGIDDDCDGMSDCADSDCLGASCDDASVCTENDACAADGTCTGTAITCADENPCTDDACDPASGCTFTNNTASCDDGFWCNGPDQCTDGACVAVGPPPCASFCNETTMACDQCFVDADCGTASTSSWGACDYGSTCDESATQTRSVMTPRCMAGVCTVETTMESQPCTRDTDGTSCGTTTYSSWGSCNWADACDESASQSRTRTEHHCSSGTCASQNFNESRSCSRNVADGTSCGSNRWMRCCSAHCRDLRTNAHCGGCGVNCNTIGLNCAGTGTGGYSCRGCSSNAQCRSILNSNATCYNIASPPAWCQCQCASTGVCANGGCGAGMYCHSCPGTNFCAPFGGGC